MFMTRLLSASNSGRPVQEFLKTCSFRSMVYCLANAWKAVETMTPRNGWHRLWPPITTECAADGEAIIDSTGVSFEESGVYMNFFLLPRI
ncbi:hypothetical protein M514_05790 [Trichuris suis]|uniref:DDE-1 domain-containing protein n=1 Tax=Trichuris suis TaxID=68888 RepID=A0A085NAA0_9BILA|nr:hypothetical protein M513_05790 [Trichuris suis]KFD66396.1 hypothetical protein M514_05790 [Trichuris suis]